MGHATRVGFRTPASSSDRGPAMLVAGQNLAGARFAPMATVTGATVTFDGVAANSDCHGNNCAIICPVCSKGAVLLVARPNQRGSDAMHPSDCRTCGAKIWITTSVDDGAAVKALALSRSGGGPGT
jgi:hypothetical protein